MKHFAYAYRNVILNVFDKPFFELHEQDKIAELVKRSCKLAKPEEIPVIKERELFFLGFYDDEKGTFESLDKPELLVICRDEVKTNEQN